MSGGSLQVPGSRLMDCEELQVHGGTLMAAEENGSSGNVKCDRFSCRFMCLSLPRHRWTSFTPSSSLFCGFHSTSVAYGFRISHSMATVTGGQIRVDSLVVSGASLITLGGSGKLPFDSPCPTNVLCPDLLLWAAALAKLDLWPRSCNFHFCCECGCACVQIIRWFADTSCPRNSDENFKKWLSFVSLLFDSIMC